MGVLCCGEAEIVPGLLAQLLAKRGQMPVPGRFGQRLLDGRQLAVPAHCASGQHEEAGQIPREATVTQPWEHALAACPHAISQPAGAPVGTPGSATHMGA